MRYIWDNIEKKNWRAENKYKAALLILGILFGMAGLIIWGVVQIWALRSFGWMFCFVGYPVVLSWIVVLFYSGKHDFHDGKR